MFAFDVIKTQVFAWFLVSTSQGSYHAKYHLTNLMKIMKEELEEGKLTADIYLNKYRQTKYNKSVNIDSAKNTPLELH